MKTQLAETQDYLVQIIAERDTLRAQNARLVAALTDVLRDRVTQVNLHQMPPAIRARIEKARALLAEIEKGGA